MEYQEGTGDARPNGSTNQSLEVVPTLDYYRHRSSIRAIQRPSLVQLVQNGVQASPDASQVGVNGKNEKPELEERREPKLGWIEGVLIRSILNIWGIPLFFRMSWIAAQAGILQAMIIIGISTFITVVTTLSMSALSTNGEVKGGGMYYMLSRSLGPAWGGSLGAVFSFANSATAALHIVGFSEILISILEQYGLTITGDSLNDNRVISLILITAMQGVILIGKEFEAKCQLGLFVIILLTIGDFIVGCILGPQDDLSKARGFVGISSGVFLQNIGPGYRASEGVDQNFFTILSIFFQAAAGIQAGASSSGDLKDPSSAIPKGTLIAIAFTSLSYALFAVVPAAGTLREATGNINDVVNGTYVFTNCTVNCKWGLYNDYQVAKLMSAVSWIMYAGCFAAALSDCLSCLIGGIEMFSALGKDEIYPYTKKLGKGFGKQLEPYYSYLVGYLIAASFVLIGDYNTIAPLISNMFMVTYAYLNFAVFFAGTVQPIGWRPSFKYCNRWLSLLGCALCVAMIFLINWKAGVVSVVCVLLLFTIAKYKKNPDLSWGDVIEAKMYTNAISAIQKAADLPYHPKNYRPQPLVLAGEAGLRPYLLEMGQLLTNNRSLMILANIQKSNLPGNSRNLILEEGKNWIKANKVDAYYQMVDQCSLDKGAKYLLQSAGMGTLSPNILMMGYKNDWQSCPSTDLLEYFGVIRETFNNDCAIAVLRVKHGLDVSKSSERVSQNGHNDTKISASYINHISPDPTDPELGAQDAAAVVNTKPEMPRLKHNSLFSASKKKTIDVWWLYDDGGLTLLLPYIISARKSWELCNLRIFVLSDGHSVHDEEKTRMSILLKKFRIKYSELIIINLLSTDPPNNSFKFFDALVKPFKESSDATRGSDVKITDTDLRNFQAQTNRHLWLRDHLLKNSINSDLIVMTLPIPQKDVPPSIYLAWLETLTCDLPPFLLVRGNQLSVLTFYS